MELPNAVKDLLSRLAGRGYEAFAVGGCVRDTLLGRRPGDWDICTSALPEETEACFSDCRVIETGMKHGTVTVLWAGEAYEITTYRSDGAYTDHRRPETVTFVRSLTEDLRRRDFTVNAMAADGSGTIFDPFGGQADLAAGILRAVGEPEQRFREDALRILRGLRFASQLGFTLEPETALAMENCKGLLAYVSGERIMQELNKLLMGPCRTAVLRKYSAILGAVLPEILPAVGFSQHSRWHDRDVWEHTLGALEQAEPDLYVRWAVLLHDLGKPASFTVDETGAGHFYGHAEISEAMAREIFARFRSDNATRDSVCSLIRYHGSEISPDRKPIRRWIGRLGADQLFRLLEVMRCDAMGQAPIPEIQQRLEKLRELNELTKAVLEEESCFSIRDLAVNGRDAMELGAEPGPEIGKLLSALLGDVLEQRCENTPEALRGRLREMLRREEPPERTKPC